MKAAVKRELINTLQSRFDQNTGRHPGIEWSAVQIKLEANSRVLETLYEMERTGGEPDVIGLGKRTEFGQVFLYHNGAESYYAARALRGLVRL